MRTLNLIICALCLVWLATPAFAAKAKYKEGEVSGGGTIEGSVVYHGIGEEADHSAHQGQEGVRPHPQGAADTRR